MLQHEIRDTINEAIDQLNGGIKSEVQMKIALINDKIYKFNQSWPPPLPKGSVTAQKFTGSLGAV